MGADTTFVLHEVAFNHTLLVLPSRLEMVTHCLKAVATGLVKTHDVRLEHLRSGLPLDDFILRDKRPRTDLSLHKL